MAYQRESRKVGGWGWAGRGVEWRLTHKGRLLWDDFKEHLLEKEKRKEKQCLNSKEK